MTQLGDEYQDLNMGFSTYELCPWINHLIFLRLNFPTCNMETIILILPSMLAHAYNPSIREVEAGASLGQPEQPHEFKSILSCVAKCPVYFLGSAPFGRCTGPSRERDQRGDTAGGKHEELGAQRTGVRLSSQVLGQSPGLLILWTCALGKLVARASG